MSVYGISGGPIEQFREGWALLPFMGGHRPHYWKRQGLTKVFDSLCGRTYEMSPHPGVKPLEPGVFMVDRCKNCSRMHQRDAQSSGGERR